MRSWPISLALGAMTLLSGCSALNPYETLPEAPPKGVVDARPRVGVCFDGLASSAAKVEAAARQACPPATSPRRVAADYELLTCPLLLPERATFVCVPKK